MNGSDIPVERVSMGRSSESPKGVQSVWSGNAIARRLLEEPLSLISVNPFVNHWTWTKLDTLQVYTVGLLMIAIRLVPFLVIMLAAGITAKLFIWIIELLNRLGFNSEPTRLFARNICFFLIRTALFFSGFYWIRVVDRRKDKTRMAPIISVTPHSSFFDIIIILKLQNPTFVSKSDNIDAFLIGNILRLCKGIYVNRSDKDSRAATIKAIRERAESGEHVLIFPEGTCANRTSLVQFKLGAFIPHLPVQPIIVKWDAGDLDSVTWSWEGPSASRVFLHTLTRISTNCEITILPEYVPNAAEVAQPRLFAENVCKLMCSELGVLQSFYSYDDVSLMPVVKAMGLFRSPVCITLFKLGQKMFHKKTEVVSRSTMSLDSANIQSKQGVGNQQSLLPWNQVGEDVDHAFNQIEVATPQNYAKNSTLKELAQHALAQLMSKVKSSRSSEGRNEFQYFPVSGARRQRYARGRVAPPSTLPHEKRNLFEHFCQLVEHCLTVLENNFEYRAIESSDHVIQLLQLEQFAGSEEVIAHLRTTSLFVDLIKIMELSVAGELTTGHLLIMLHLCDLRERDPWERIRVAVKLFHMMRHRGQPSVPGTGNEEYWLNSPQFRTFLWYLLGLQEFNDQFFVQYQFDFGYLREHLCKVFRRAVHENAPNLLA